MLSRLTVRQVSKRTTNVLAIATRGIFYECSTFSLPKHERSLIEKSVNAGCNSFFTRSNAFTAQILEHLADLQYELSENAEEGQQPRRMSLGHIISPPKNVSNEQFVPFLDQEMQKLVTNLEKNHQHLDLLSITFPSTMWQTNQIPSILSNFTTQFQPFLEKSQTKVGLDVSTRILMELSTNQLLPTFQTLLNQNSVRVITLATNPFSATNAMKLREQLDSIDKNSSCEIFGTEILRLHPVKPGQISPNYSYKFPHHYRFNSNSPDDEKDSKAANNSPVVEMVETTLPDGSAGFVSSAELSEGETLSAVEQEAMLDLRTALDRAITIEKIFLEKYATKAKSMNVQITDICLGHMVARIHDKMTYVEEYEFFLASHMDPLFEQALEIITKSDVDMRNWVALYRPIAHYLQASYRNLLQLRQLQMVEKLTKKMAIDSVTVDKVPYFFATCVQKQFRLTDVGLSLMVTSPEQYQSFLKSTTDTKDVLSFFQEAKHVYEDFNNSGSS